MKEFNNSRTIYVKDIETWNRAKELAKAEGLSMSALIDRELRIWIAKRERWCVK
jgi:hypothetical protein